MARIFQERTHTRLKDEPLPPPSRDGEPPEVGWAINRAADGTARALNSLTGKRWRMPGLILVLLGFALPLMWLVAAGYFILMIVLKHEGLGPWKD